MLNLERKIKVAHGEEPADLLLKNARVVNVFSGEIHRTPVAIAQGLIIGLGDYQAHKEIDLKNSYLSPGFIDGHIHLESTMVTPAEFAQAAVPLGTTTVVIDPHEIANVLGLDGIRYMLESSRGLPLNVYLMLPSCVPATEMETAGAHLSSQDLAYFINQKNVLGVGEMMNFPGVIGRDPEVMKKILIAGPKRIDGHAPLLTGKDLAAYVVAGIGSDHECTQLEEAKEKLRLGLHVMIREGSTAKNLDALLPLITPVDSRRLLWVSDDILPGDLLGRGHINYCLNRAITLGVEPSIALQMATINAAEYFHLEDLGAIAPGYRADLVVFDDLQKISPRLVFKDGKLVAQEGALLSGTVKHRKIVIRSTINLEGPTLKSFEIPAGRGPAKIIGIIPDQIITRKILEQPKIEAGKVVADPQRDILKMAVVERHMASGRCGLGLVKGMGLKAGALASSVAHDSHNIVVVGTKDEDMLLAVKEVGRLRGGQVVVKEGKILASLALPIAGLMSDRPLEEVRNKIEGLQAAAKSLGCPLSNPFMALSFLALPVIPELKLTDYGLVDVGQFKLVPIFGE